MRRGKSCIQCVSHIYKGSKNISIKMLKDVGMTVPKSRETSAVCICSNTGNEGTIFICRMKAVHNNMHQDRG